MKDLDNLNFGEKKDKLTASKLMEAAFDLKAT